jgi:hypothetical protein
VINTTNTILNTFSIMGKSTINKDGALENGRGGARMASAASTKANGTTTTAAAAEDGGLGGFDDSNEHTAWAVRYTRLF